MWEELQRECGEDLRKIQNAERKRMLAEAKQKKKDREKEREKVKENRSLLLMLVYLQQF